MNNSTVVSVSTSAVLLSSTVTRYVYNILPISFLILGTIGFLGNALTYSQRELRSNTCCIYLLCGSIVDMLNLFMNLLPRFLNTMNGIYIPWLRLPSFCQFYISILGFLPHLSINFLLMSIIDRYALTCNLASPIRRINRLTMAPVFVLLAIFTSGLTTIRTIVLYEYRSAFGCTATHPLTNNILYVMINGVMQPVIMFIFVMLTFQNIKHSRKRVGGATGAINIRRSRRQFVTMIFTQIIATGVISLQWIVMFSLSSFVFSSIQNYGMASVVLFTYTVSNYCFYLNSVKAFYIALFTSRLFRENFVLGLMKMLPRRMREQFRISQANIAFAIGTVTNQANPRSLLMTRRN
ncbi:unnamed protein product [Adineta ricciae]|uniref:G-protein coupled receptors family 1 profile domain-containing protein n=1 Tax=Adineta ricciae TaxID=249248 RepID=A0A814VG76_ADIRI|nr:unnamed protein product [Adineta ricciae]CAF1591857.1 unnamed protein product [Adineta ricciae]